MEIRKIESREAPAAIGPYSQAVEVNGFVYTSGQIPINPYTGEIPASIEEQTEQVFKNLKAVLEEAGSSLCNVVKATVFLKDMNHFGTVNNIYSSAFVSNKVLPARSAIEVARLPKDVLVEIEVIATLC